MNRSQNSIQNIGPAKDTQNSETRFPQYTDANVMQRNQQNIRNTSNNHVIVAKRAEGTEHKVLLPNHNIMGNARVTYSIYMAAYI